MTIAHSPIRKPRRGKLAKPVSADDVSALQDLAEKLNGQPVPGLRLSEQEFEDWCDPEVRAEWVDGEVILLAPDNTDHADVNSWLGGLLRFFIEKNAKGGRILHNVPMRIHNVPSRRVPDTCFISKNQIGIIRETYIDGLPDLAVEIVSPESANRDRGIKYLEYEAAGIREYWIIDAKNRRFDALWLGRNKKYVINAPDQDGRIYSKTVRGFFLRPEWLWERPLPPMYLLLDEMNLSE